MTEVRIIGGQWKRTPIRVPDVPGLRPTPDRVRETLFNWLGQDLNGWRCLDPFAGTGALGFEAASRGAAQVTLIERQPVLAKALSALKSRLSADAVTVVRADCASWLAGMPPSAQDLILLDPPFGDGWLARLLPVLKGWLAPGGQIYAECELALSTDNLAAHGGDGFRVTRAGRAGQVHYHLLELMPSLEPDSESRACPSSPSTPAPSTR
jgi:16S rRNA (guanine966-N2)-methyltransferase